MKDSRSSVSNESVQELLDANGGSVKLAIQRNAQQYPTGKDFAEHCANRLVELTECGTLASAIDPQSHEGRLLGNLQWPTTFGMDIDQRLKPDSIDHFINANCVKVMELLDELFPEAIWECGVANPPFGLNLATKQGKVDSTLLTWNWLQARTNCGFIIANDATLRRFGIDTHPSVLAYETKPGNELWKGMSDELVIGVAWFKRQDDREATRRHELVDAFDTIRDILEEEKRKLPEFNVWLKADGTLGTYLSTRSKVKFKLTQDDLLTLTRLTNCTPLALCVDVETQRILAKTLACGFYTVSPEAKAAIESAIAETEAMSVPIMACSPFELVAYADHLDCLTCIATPPAGMAYTVGKSYKLRTQTYTIKKGFTRKKAHFDEGSNSMYSVVHNCELTGQDRLIAIEDDDEREHFFMDSPRAGQERDHEESLLWQIFERPVVKTVADVYGKEIAETLKRMEDLEFFANFKFYPGQAEYVARMAMKDYGLIAAAVGTGKTLMALTLIALKAPYRALICAPQGTMRSSDEDEGEEGQSVSQWVNSIAQFAPGMAVFELFSYADYLRIKELNGGELPCGIYCTYPAALASNGARETCPPTWTDERMVKEFCAGTNLDPAVIAKTLPADNDPAFWAKSIGKEKDGLRCILDPSLATLIGHEFDMVILDEAHIAKNLEAGFTQQIIRLQPRYRYAMSATPVSNTLADLFSLMGFLCTPDFYKGGRRSAAWPYAREEQPRFNDTFMSEERDYTAEEMKRSNDSRWRGKCIKVSPVISSPARLLKLLKPSMGYISMEQIKPGYVEGELVNVRVPLGKQQAKLYSHFLNRANIRHKSPLTKARVQGQYLRGATSDPAGFEHGGPKVQSNFNPKTFAIINLIRDVIAMKEQVLFISSRVGLTSTIATLLKDAGLPFARIDSTIPAQEFARESNTYKGGAWLTPEGKRNPDWCPVLLMGLKCAAGYSYSEQPYSIIAGLDWNCGSFTQARGRNDRADSKRRAKTWCVLCDQSIEDLMYSTVCLKDDASAICLKGQRIPRDYKTCDASEILAEAIAKFDFTKAVDEADICQQWPALKADMQRLAKAQKTH